MSFSVSGSTLSKPGSNNSRKGAGGHGGHGGRVGSGTRARPGARRTSGGDAKALNLGVAGTRTGPVVASKNNKPSNSTLRTTRKIGKPQVSKSAVEILEEETQRMEERLKALRTNMKSDKIHWDNVQRNKEGNLWAGSSGGINYTQKVMDKVTKKNKRFDTTRQLSGARARPGSRGGRRGSIEDNNNGSTQKIAAKALSKHDANQYTPPRPGSSRTSRQNSNNAGSYSPTPPHTLIPSP